MRRLSLNSLVEVYERLRPSKIQRAAGSLVIGGLAILTLSFNELLAKIAFEALGFKTDGYASLLVALVLIVIGISSLLADRYLESFPTQSGNHDSQLVTRVSEQLDWDTLKWFTIAANNLEYEGNQSRAVRQLLWFFEDPKNHFSNERLESNWIDFYEALTDLVSLTGSNFFPVKDNWYKFYPNHMSHEYSPKMIQVLSEISELSEVCRDRYRRIFETAIRCGLMTSTSIVTPDAEHLGAHL